MRFGPRRMILIALFGALTAVGGLIKIPMGVLSFTLQVFFCLLSGMLLGPIDGALSQALYIIIGLAGVPVFSQGGGIAYVMMPSFGYLLGLIPCAYLAGRVARDPGAGLPRMMAGAGAGILALYLIGVPYLYFMVNAFSGAMTFGSALWSGMIMFLPIDIAKGLLASIVTIMVRRRLPPGARSPGSSDRENTVEGCRNKDALEKIRKRQNDEKLYPMRKRNRGRRILYPLRRSRRAYAGSVPDPAARAAG